MTTKDKSSLDKTLRSSSLYYDQARIQTLQYLLCNRLEEVFDRLGLSFHRTNKLFVGPCPVHGGDNQSAFNLYHGGDLPGKWRCNTRHCEGYFKKTIIGFIRGSLSHQKYNWCRPESPKSATFKETVDWCCDLIGQSLATIEVNEDEIEKRAFVSTSSVVSKRQFTQSSSITRAHVRDRLQIPAQYFVDRGWSAEILNKYDVGLCNDPGKPFYNRCVVPIYDNTYTSCVGFTARSVFSQCAQCRLWHHSNVTCPSSAHEKDACSKWRNSDGFAKESYLYNFWFAQKHIRSTGKVILCEGPGDVWKLCESGHPEAVALLGTSLTDQQQILLETSGARTIIVLTDADSPGREAAKNITKQLNRLYRVHVPELPKNDLGDMTITEISNMLENLKCK